MHGNVLALLVATGTLATGACYVLAPGGASQRTAPSGASTGAAPSPSANAVITPDPGGGTAIATPRPTSPRPAGNPQAIVIVPVPAEPPGQPSDAGTAPAAPQGTDIRLTPVGRPVLGWTGRPECDMPRRYTGSNPVRLANLTRHDVCEIKLVPNEEIGVCETTASWLPAGVIIGSGSTTEVAVVPGRYTIRFNVCEPEYEALSFDEDQDLSRPTLVAVAPGGVAPRSFAVPSGYRLLVLEEEETAGDIEAGGRSEPVEPAPAVVTTSGPESVSVMLRNECDHAVDYFYGSDSGNGTRSSLDSSSSTSLSGWAPLVICILEDGDCGSRVEAGTSSREVVIGRDCTSLSSR